MLGVQHAECRVLRELLGVERRAAAFEHDRLAADSNRQIADAAAEARLDPLTNRDGEVALAFGSLIRFRRMGGFETGAGEDYFVRGGIRLLSKRRVLAVRRWRYEANQTTSERA